MALKAWYKLDEKKSYDEIQTGSYYIIKTGEGFTFSFPKIPKILQDSMILEISQNDLENNIDISINGILVVDGIYGTNAVTETKSWTIPSGILRNSTNFVKIYHNGGSDDWGYIYSVRLYSTTEYTEDSSGNENDLEYKNNTNHLTLEEGKINKCLKRETYGDSSDYFRAKSKFNFQGDFTFSCWAKVKESQGTANGIITNHANSTNSGAGINTIQLTDTDIRISCSTGNGTSRTFRDYYGEINIYNEWHLLSLRYRRATNTLALLVDGIVDREIIYDLYTIEDYFDVFGWSTSYEGSASYRPACSIDDVRIYDNALSDKEIKLLAQAKILHYKFDDFQEPTENIMPSSCDYGDFENGSSSSIGVYNNGSAKGIVVTHSVVSASSEGLPSPPNGSDKVLKIVIDNTVNLTDATGFYLATSSTYGTTCLANKVYTQSAWMLIPESPLYCGYTNNGGITNNEIVVPTPDGISWKRYTRTFTVGTSDYAGGLHFYVRRYGIHTFYVDLHQLEQKDHATPFVDGIRTGKVNDCSGYENDANLELATTPQWTSDSKLGSGAYKFDGNNTSNFYCPTIGIVENYTITFWAKRYAEHKMLIGSCGASRNGSFYWYGDSSWRYTHGGVGGEFYYTKTVSIPLNVWGHYAVTYNGTQIEIFRNGISQGAKLTSGLADFSSGFSVGCGYGNITYDFIGEGDDIHFYATALSAEDIKELYQERANLDDLGTLSMNEIEHNSINRCPSFSDWGLGSGAYLDGDRVVLPNFGASVSSPYIYIGDNSNWTFSADFFSSDSAEVSENGGFLMNSHYYDGSFNPTENINGYTGNGHADSYPINEWTRKVWGYVGGNEVRYIKFSISSNISYSAASFKIKNGMVTTNLLWENFYDYSSRYVETPASVVGIAQNGIGTFNNISELGPTDGLVGYWPLDGDTKDYSENSNNGVNNGATISSGYNGSLSYMFNETSNYINILGNSTIEPENLTVSAWINMDTTAPIARNIFCTKWSGYSFEIEETSRIPYFRLTGPGDCRSSSALTLGSWQLLVGTFEKGIGSKIYLDGVLKGTTNTATPITYSANAVLNVGRYAGGVYFNGKIQDVRIYNRALSAEEIEILYTITSESKVKMKQSSDTLYVNQISEV